MAVILPVMKCVVRPVFFIKVPTVTFAYGTSHGHNRFNNFPFQIFLPSSELN